MITIITGTPGAGKTLYAISKLLRSLVGTFVEQEVDGVKVQIPRTIFTNINGLLIDHELIDEREGGGLHDWHKWAKPGSVIVFDEVQRAWPPRPNGSKVPEDLSALDTHRHMGVDFILITQNVMQVDRHIHALGGRHLHVRRMGNMGLTIVYEWDHVSRQLMYSKALTKSPWRYDKSVFQLYKSAELHTKQPRKLPGLVWFIAAGLIGLTYFMPTVYGRIQDRVANGGAAPGTGVASLAKQPGTPALPASAPYGSGFPTMPPPNRRGGPLGTPVDAPEVMAGCVSMRGVCSCFNSKGAKVNAEPEVCLASVGADRPTLVARLPDSLREHATPAAPGRWTGFVDAPKPYHLTVGDVVATFHKP